MASPRMALGALGLATALVLASGGSAQAFGGAGESEMPVEHYCLRGVHGSYIIIASALVDEASVMFPQSEQSEFVPAGPDGCEDHGTVERASSSFYAGQATAASTTPAAVAPAPSSPMVPVDLAYYMTIYHSQGTEAADAWARSQHYR